MMSTLRTRPCSHPSGVSTRTRTPRIRHDAAVAMVVRRTARPRRRARARRRSHPERTGGNRRGRHDVEQGLHFAVEEARDLAVAVRVSAAAGAVVVAVWRVDAQAATGARERDVQQAPFLRDALRGCRQPCRPGSSRRRRRSGAPTATRGPWRNARSRAPASPRRDAGERPGPDSKPAGRAIPPRRRCAGPRLLPPP